MVNARLCEKARRREGKNSIFLCEPETFLLFQLEDRDLKCKLEKLLDIQMSFKNKQIITS